MEWNLEVLSLTIRPMKDVCSASEAMFRLVVGLVGPLQAQLGAIFSEYQIRFVFLIEVLFLLFLVDAIEMLVEDKCKLAQLLFLRLMNALFAFAFRVCSCVYATYMFEQVIAGSL